MELQIIDPVRIPNNLPSPDFPAIPSWKYYYLDNKGNPTSYLNTGSLEDQEKSILAWYGCKSPKNQIWTPYARQSLAAPPERSGYARVPYARQSLSIDGDIFQDATGWDIAASMKLRLRQKPTLDSIILPDNLQPILFRSNKTMEDYINDIYLFPMHPSANIILAADLTVHRNVNNIRKYFSSRGINHLNNQSLDYYPEYYLFFLLTRFASYPFSEDQITLIQLRKENKEKRHLIDSVFEVRLTSEILRLITMPLEESTRLVQGQPGWTKFGNEYLRFLHPGQTEGFDYQETDLNTILEMIPNWTDQQIIALCRSKNLSIPTLDQFSSRIDWITDVLSTLRRFR